MDIGFRFIPARKLKHELPTAQKVGLLRYTGSNTLRAKKTIANRS
jgi:hypothetical protein